MRSTTAAPGWKTSSNAGARSRSRALSPCYLPGTERKHLLAQVTGDVSEPIDIALDLVSK
jgi:hypothetical protein